MDERVNPRSTEPSTIPAEPLPLATDPPVPPVGSARDLIPWVTETAFIAGLLLIGLIVFLVLASGANPFATLLVPVILVVAAVAALARHRWVRRHQTNAEFVHARHVARERRGF